MKNNMEAQEIVTVVKKLVGIVRPYGDASIDRERFENLQVMCKVVEFLISELDGVRNDFKNHNEGSIKKSVEYVNSFLQELLRSFGQWTSAKDKLPTVAEHGDKVLLYRLTNESQKALSVTIHDTTMVKFCNDHETWWMPLPTT